MVRLFVALRPPPDVRAALLAAHGGVVGARWQTDEQLHLTLRFIGEVAPRVADDLCTSLDAVDGESISLSVCGVGHFERRGRPTALWAAVSPTDKLSRLHRAVERACRGAGLPSEPRGLVPHVTLARLGSGAAGAGEWLARNGNLSAPEWRVGSFGLYESRLHPGGSRYATLVQWPLTRVATTKNG